MNGPQNAGVQPHFARVSIYGESEDHRRERTDTMNAWSRGLLADTAEGGKQEERTSEREREKGRSIEMVFKMDGRGHNSSGREWDEEIFADMSMQLEG